MSLTPIFWDSFDHYNTLSEKWDVDPGASASIDLTGTLSRTGIGCLLIATAFGPGKVLTQTDHPFSFTGFWIPNAPGANALSIMRYRDTTAANAVQLSLVYNADLSVSVWQGDANTGTEIERSAANVLIPASWNFIVWRALIAHAGSTRVRVNGVQVIDGNCDTQKTANAFIDYWELMGRGAATFTDRHDDAAFFTWSSNADDLTTAPAIYAAVPSADNAPLQWSPSTGLTHFNLVNTRPPDTTKYVFTATSGFQDQYIHSIPVDEQVPAIPGSPLIIAAQHVLLAELDSNGVQKLNSDVGGIAGPVQSSPGQSWHMFTTPYATNPVSGVAWLLTDLATVPFGPKCTT